MKKILFSIGMLALGTAAFSQNCFEISNFAVSSPNGSGIRTITFDYATDGQKSLFTEVRCNGVVTFSDCFQTNGSGSKVYSITDCNGMLDISSTPFTGNCGAAQCGPTTRSINGGVLPINLTEFSAVRSKQSVTLNWSTELEIDAKEFIVERAEGIDFRSVGTIPSNGNSSTKKSYSFNDKNENASVTYYRLKNVDLNGKYTYSDIKTVKGIGAVSDVTVFPNPARTNSKISLVGINENSSIQLLDFSGKILKNINSNTMNSFILTDIKNGNYLIRIIDKKTNEVVNKKLSVSN